MKMKKRNAMSAFITGALVSGAAITNVQAADMFQCDDLGSGAELRSDLLGSPAVEIKNMDASCGESKTSTEGKKSESKAAEHKCGEGKCGEGKCGDEHKEMKTEKKSEKSEAKSENKSEKAAVKSEKSEGKKANAKKADPK